MSGHHRLMSYLCCGACSQTKESSKVIDSKYNDPTKTYIHAGIDALNVSPRIPLVITDFGSSHGHNAIRLMKAIIDYLQKSYEYQLSLIIIHNDLPNNDWSKLFQLMSEEESYFGLANGRSFYEQCLPSNSLSLGFCAASLHYLSRKPCHIRHHCYIHFADKHEQLLFQDQARLDFASFIQHRAEELRSGGILILSIPSQPNRDELNFEYYFDLIYRCAQSTGLFSAQELIDFTIPFYLRSFNECVDEDLFHRSSLKLIRTELICLKSFIFEQYQQGHLTRDQLASSLTLLMRPGTESTLEQALRINGRSEEEISRISKQFWSFVEKKICEQISDHIVHTYATYLILKKK